MKPGIYLNVGEYFVNSQAVQKELGPVGSAQYKLGARAREGRAGVDPGDFSSVMI